MIEEGVILAGGKGTRLYPLTRTINKHLHPVWPEPMIYNLIKNMKTYDIKDVRIVTSYEHMGQMVSSLGSGNDFGLNLSYSFQDKAKGNADALRLARNFVGKDNVMVLLGDNFFFDDIIFFAQNFSIQLQNKDARVLMVEVNDPQRFGITNLDENNVIEIQEKQQQPKTNYVVVGVYIYDSSVFDIIEKIEPSDRGEYEITSVNNRYIEKNELKYDFVNGKWKDTGNFESYHKTNKIMFEKYFAKQQKIHE